MKVTNIRDLKVGLIVAENIYTYAGQLIIPANSSLTKQMILHLSFYGINEIPIEDGPVSNEVEKLLLFKQQVEQTYENNLENSPVYKEFKESYQKNIDLVEKNFNDIILKNTEIDEPNLIMDTVKLFDQQPNTYSLLGTLHSMKKLDDSTYAHCINVAIISRLIGTWLGLETEDLNHLTLAGLLHDIGKCKIPDNILLKPGKLTAQEYEFIKLHPDFGYDILKRQNIDERVKDAAHYHHERFDGTGYPDQLSGDQISQFTSIVSISDVYDAMTSNRCYRGALCPFDVVAEFLESGIGKYNTGIVMMFLERIADSYVNSTVLLSDNQTARIIMTNKRMLTRPIIQIGDDFINLEDRPDLYIVAIV